MLQARWTRCLAVVVSEPCPSMARRKAASPADAGNGAGRDGAHGRQASTEHGGPGASPELDGAPAVRLSTVTEATPLTSGRWPKKNWEYWQPGSVCRLRRRTLKPEQMSMYLARAGDWVVEVEQRSKRAMERYH